jgi:hypothetical protein
VIEIFAITDAQPDDSQGLTAVHSDGLVALCAPADEIATDVSADRLWRHEEVVETLMDECDLLPVRYGTRVEDEAAAERVLSDRRHELANALERVRGAVELSVRVFSEDAGDDVPPAQGADYLRWRTRREQSRLEVRARVHGQLVRLTRDSVQNAPSDPHEILREAYLVDRDEVDTFVKRVVEIEAANPRLRLLCTGPWPPYSFASP